jgi:hypothetical protein
MGLGIKTVAVAAVLATLGLGSYGYLVDMAPASLPVTQAVVIPNAP